MNKQRQPQRLENEKNSMRRVRDTIPNHRYEKAVLDALRIVYARFNNRTPSANSVKEIDDRSKGD